MASKGILEQYVSDFEDAEQRYQQQRRQYDNSYVGQGDGAKVFATRPHAGIFGIGGSSTQPYELNDQGKPNTRKPGDSSNFYQPYASFTGGINASINSPAYIARTPESMKLEGRTPVTEREYYVIPGDEESGRKERLISADQYRRLERDNRSGDSWTDLSGAQKTNLYFDDKSGRAVSASNTGDNPSKIVQGEDGQYYLETYSYKGEPKHTALRMYKSSRAQQEKIKAAENKVASATASYLRSDNKSRAKRRKGRMDAAIAERDKLKENFNPRFHGMPEFTAAEIRKMQGPDQSAANAERDGGRSQLQKVQQANQWSPFAASNRGEGVLIRAMKNSL